MQSVVIVLTQVLIPAAVLVWYAAAPLRNLAGLLCLAVGLLLLLFLATRVLMWAALPWWLPWIHVLIAAGITVWHLFTLPLSTLPVWPSGWSAWLNGASALLLLVVGLWGSAQLVTAGRLPSGEEVIDIPNPLGPGRYLVGHGGFTTALNAHLQTLDATVERFQPWRGQSHAYDIVGINALGTHADGWRPRDPARYEIFGAAVHAPCAGTVLQIETTLPDLPVPEADRERLMGNHVLLQCEADVVLVFAHLRQGSVRVEPGARVRTGDLLGEVGNSGNTSEPHLHIHAQRPGSPEAPLSGDPLPLTINGRVLLRNARIHGGQW